MEVAKTRNTRVTCSAQYLESYFLKSVLEYGNNDLSREMGIHPSSLSRDKNRIAKLASLMIVNLGLPEGSVAAPGCEANIVLTGVEASKLLSILDELRYPKRKTPVALTTEASEKQLELLIE
ncbi:hypothetical protein ABLB84_06275 [Xenorhabdus szentirmaii]|uniref:Transcriptional regulator n=1 Tax=Xenorhabdus szentirmaii TaxID=290112 RepID=A0AAW3Z1X2_9GAMM|nr:MULTISPECIES: hypothetical protein [unclassified Xenorhabdus]MBD2803049.1 hypothetical protein [Xenorhabdus sp. M]MBD2804096.1 hypothetical protein [Xenorhabdus sp. ZM]